MVVLILIKMSSKSKPSIKGSVITNKYNSNEKSISQHMRRTNDLCIKSRMNLHKLDPHDIISHSPRYLKFFQHYISTEPLNLRHFGKPEIDVEEMPICKLGSISSTFKSLPISKSTSILEQAGSIKSGQLIVQRKTRNLLTMIDDAEITYHVAVYNRFKLELDTVEALNRHISQLIYIKNVIGDNKIISNACCSSLFRYLSKVFCSLSPLDQLENEVDTELKMVLAQLEEAKHSAPNDARMRSSLPESHRRMQKGLIGAPSDTHLSTDMGHALPSGTGILKGPREEEKMCNPSQLHRIDFADAHFSSALSQKKVIKETEETMDKLITLDNQLQGFDSCPKNLEGIITILKEAYVLTRDYRSKLLRLFPEPRPDPVVTQEESEIITQTYLRNDGIKDVRKQFPNQIKKFKICLAGSFPLQNLVDDIYNFVKLLYPYSLGLNRFKES